MRCFVAIDINKKIKDNIWNIVKHLDCKAVKLVKKKQYHITLDFLGDVSEKYAMGIGDKIENLNIGSFKSVFKGLGVFPKMSYIKIIWAGTEAGNRFKELVKKMDRATERKRERPFHPHVTIARVKKKPPEKVKDLIKNNQNVKFGKQSINQIIVKKSELTPEGPIYTNLKTVNL